MSGRPRLRVRKGVAVLPFHPLVRFSASLAREHCFGDTFN